MSWWMWTGVGDGLEWREGGAGVARRSEGERGWGEE